MRKLWLFSILLFIAGCVTASGQTTDCPADKVCLTQQQAAKYLTLEDTVKAQENEILALKQAVLDQKLVTMDVKIELAKTVGQLTATQQAIVQCNVDKEMLIKFGRVKKNGFINF